MGTRQGAEAETEAKECDANESGAERQREQKHLQRVAVAPRGGHDLPERRARRAARVDVHRV